MNRETLAKANELIEKINALNAIIDQDELKAIVAQAKELGWLDE